LDEKRTLCSGEEGRISGTSVLKTTGTKEEEGRRINSVSAVRVVSLQAHEGAMSVQELPVREIFPDAP